MITVDINKAKEIHKDYIRQARKDALSKLDVEFQMALEKKDVKKQEEVAALKQTLRDLPAHPDIAKADSVEKLKKVWPSILGTR